MKRWGIGFLLVLLSCVPIFLHRESGPELLQDTDTKVLLETIRKADDPWGWFVRDWPLDNHFYRPVSTLAFEFDSRIHGDHAAGYGITNALLCIACVLLLFWLLRELCDDPALATGGAVLFGLWNAQGTGWMAVACAYLSWMVLALWLLPGRRFGPAALAWLGVWYLASEFVGVRDLETRALDWIPGRTATVMTVFALSCMAAYCRYERLGAARYAKAAPSPLDPPATKGTAPVSRPGGTTWPWLAGSVLFGALALGSYEQAVMLPALLLACAVYLRLTGLRVRWGAHVLFWSALVGYLALRGYLIGWERSDYQEQQFHSGGLSSILASVAEYVTPEARSIWTYLVSLEPAIELLLVTQFYQVLASMAATVGAGFLLIPNWRLPLLGLSMSLLAYLPMAWLIDFGHYHYWPMALRALFVVAFGKVLLGQLVIAASRRALQAPPRPDPAPGSLPRP